MFSTSGQLKSYIAIVKLEFKRDHAITTSIGQEKKNHIWWKRKSPWLNEVLGEKLFFFLPTNNSAVHIPHLNGVLVARVCIRIPLKATPGHLTHQVKTKCFGSREAQNCWEVPLKMKYVIPLKPYSVQSMVKSWWWLAAVCHLLQWVTNRRTLLLLGADSYGVKCSYGNLMVDNWAIIFLWTGLNTPQLFLKAIYTNHSSLQVSFHWCVA